MIVICLQEHPLYKKEKNLLLTGSIVACLLIVIYYVHNVDFTSAISIMELFSPLTIILFFTDPLTLVLVTALIMCISFYRHFEEKERAAWRRSHVRNTETQQMQAPHAVAAEKPKPDVIIESNEYEKLFAGGKIEIRLPRQNSEVYNAGQSLRLRLKDDFGQFKNVTILEVTAQNETDAIVVIVII